MSRTMPGRPGRPRDATVDRRVLDAAWDLLHDAGYAGLTVDEVADRAGAAKTTLYRRWPTKDHLAIALAARILGEVPIADTGDLRADLTEFAAGLAASLNRLRLAGHPDGGPSAGFAAERGSIVCAWTMCATDLPSWESKYGVSDAQPAPPIAAARARAVAMLFFKLVLLGSSR